MKTYREVIINVLQKYLDQNVGDYAYFKAETWYQKFTNHYPWMIQDDGDYDAIFTYLEKIEEEYNK